MNPLTAQQLDEIQARWAPVPKLERPALTVTCSSSPGVLLAALAAAPQDVDALLATVRQLQGQRKFLLTQLAKRDAETGRGNTALREFLAGEPAEETHADADTSSDPTPA